MRDAQRTLGLQQGRRPIRNLKSRIQQARSIISRNRFYDDVAVPAIQKNTNDNQLYRLLSEAFQNLSDVHTIRLYEDGCNPRFSKILVNNSSMDYSYFCFRQIVSALATSTLKLRKLKTVSKQRPYLCGGNQYATILPASSFSPMRLYNALQKMLA